MNMTDPCVANLPN